MEVGVIIFIIRNETYNQAQWKQIFQKMISSSCILIAIGKNFFIIIGGKGPSDILK